MFHLRSAPPPGPLLAAVSRLEGAGLVVALGGSGLLGALGLATEAHDWDLTTDSAPEDVAACFAGSEIERVGSSGIHADHKVRLAGGTVEIICGFAIRSGAGVVRIPTVVSARAEGVPLGSPEAWAVAYALLGREEKSELLMRWLATHGADTGIIARLLAEPLPHDLAARLQDRTRASGRAPGPPMSLVFSALALVAALANSSPVAPRAPASSLPPLRATAESLYVAGWFHAADSVLSVSSARIPTIRRCCSKGWSGSVRESHRISRGQGTTRLGGDGSVQPSLQRLVVEALNREPVGTGPPP